ncbi:GGDEF domain-containing protein [Rhizobacter sp. AJA081-3]|uniref:GGDEF domain-containing protein n=1 Tax=Rhizobacter sp. AJA081-3 TaxID=2753607 RepID=UPI001AE0D231|nr:GGDEF domain-containing protein [Rhizobacter sp. AJA081-3]QTN25348.1 GGDEF domain-containing protein [Rhizobacter sp. AJA081-3]
MDAGWRRIVVGSPVALTVAVVAACSVGLSVAALFGLTAALRLPQTAAFPHYVAIAVVIPLVVSVPVSWVIVRLLREVEAARRQAERLAWFDDLTGLSNRRRLCELAQRELDMAQRTGEPLVAALLDLDDFKRVNDRHGHAAGDRLLRATAQRIQAALRSTDLAARWGGEEFAVVLPRTRREDGVKVVERILGELRGLQLGESEDPFGCTASIGVAMSAGGSERFERLIDRADQAMYRAKLAGKDRWEAAPPPS